MILPLLISLIALNLLQAKHFLVETEDKKEEDRLLDLLTEKKVSAVIRDPQNAEALRKKLHQAYGDDENAMVEAVNDGSIAEVLTGGDGGDYDLFGSLGDLGKGLKDAINIGLEAVDQGKKRPKRPKRSHKRC